MGITSDWNTMSNYNRLIQGVSVNSKASQFIFTKNGNGTWVISSAWDNQFVFDMNSGSTKMVLLYKSIRKMVQKHNLGDYIKLII